MNHMTPPGAVAPALVLIGDDRLRAEVRRVAAAAERTVEERAQPVSRHAWAGAGLVILDVPAARESAAAYSRRPGIVLVTESEPRLTDWQAAAAVGAEEVIALPAAAMLLVEKFAEHAESRSGSGLVVAVAGAVGGAGASILAAGIALAGAQCRFRPATLLVDAAPCGGGVDLLLGMENVPGLRWPDLVIENGRVPAAALHKALPQAAAGLSVLSCGRRVRGERPAGRGSSGALPGESSAAGSKAVGRLGAAGVRAVVESGRAAGDLVVCDTSAERNAAADAVLDIADLVVLILPARLRAVAAAEVTADYLAARNPNRALVVRGPAPGGMRATEIAGVLGLPLLAAVRAEPRLAAGLERGGLRLRSRGPLRTAVDAVLAALEAPVTTVAAASEAKVRSVR